MTRCYCLLVLLLLCPPAHAGESFSFTVAGHRIHIEAPRHCNSASCVSVSIPGIYESRRTPDRDDDVAAVARIARDGELEHRRGSILRQRSGTRQDKKPGTPGHDQ